MGKTLTPLHTPFVAKFKFNKSEIIRKQNCLEHFVEQLACVGYIVFRKRGADGDSLTAIARFCVLQIMLMEENPRG